MCSAFEIVIGGELVRDSPSLGIAVLGTFLLVFPVCAALAMGAIAWHLFGRETIEVSPTSLTIDAALLTFHRLRCFDARLVSNLRVLVRKSKRGAVRRTIAFDCDGRSHSAYSVLSAADADVLDAALSQCSAILAWGTKMQDAAEA